MEGNLTQWPQEAATVQISEEPDRTVIAAPPKKGQSKHQRPARSGAGDTNQRSSGGGWSGIIVILNRKKTKTFR